MTTLMNNLMRPIRLNEIKKEIAQGSDGNRIPSSIVIDNILKQYPEAPTNLRSDSTLLLWVFEKHFPSMKQTLGPNVDKMLKLAKILFVEPATLSKFLVSLHNIAKNWPESRYKIVQEYSEIPKDIIEGLMKRQKEKVLEKNEHPMEISPEQFEKVFREWKASPDLANQFLYCISNTGRRGVEIIRGEFKVINPDEIQWLELAKSKNPTPLIAPLLEPGSADYTGTAITAIRKSDADDGRYKLDNAKHMHLWTGILNNRLVKAFPDQRITVHTLRAIYVSILYKRSDEKVTFNAYIKNSLGHQSLNSSVHYNDIKLVDEPAALPAEAARPRKEKAPKKLRLTPRMQELIDFEKKGPHTKADILAAGFGASTITALRNYREAMTAEK